MNPINLYTLTRITDPSEFTSYEKHLSGRAYTLQQREREIESLQVLVNMLLNEKTDKTFLDGFYYGYVIPQLGKEFDLLKFTEDAVINIELKSEDVGEERRIKQLSCNKHYLNHLGKPLISFVFISNTKELYEYKNNILLKSEMNYLKKILSEHSVSCTTPVDDLFKVSNFLVSPLNTPEKFLKGEYFLTQQQETFKERILDDISSLQAPLFFYIEGSAGTGKTLLFYDLAKNLSQTEKCCLINCGMLAPGHRVISSGIENLEIISMNAAIYDYDLSEFKYIFLDGAHRISTEFLEKIVSYVNNNRKICMFSFDKKQVLSRNETNAEITDKIKLIPDIKGMALKNRIRTNQMMQAFIRSLFCLKRKVHDIHGVSIIYANNIEEAADLIELYKKQGFTFINYTNSKSVKSNIDFFTKYEYCSTHDVIGQEFDNIIMYMDENFYYDRQGFLHAHTHPHKNYLYTNLLFQGVTRVREKLCLVVINNPQLFKNLISLVSE